MTILGRGGCNIAFLKAVTQVPRQMPAKRAKLIVDGDSAAMLEDSNMCRLCDTILQD